ncbi:glycosyltransferase family 4 protein [Candidatus Gracilibacteria bacterium]|nr:glycosyltransferase family 4 protein [Candidatus Gracilibacteria bacterium]OIO75999.1 MAG: hypothetical protein AUJ87_03775 [Candidatus Gracilibacteria bacterium CG1_02_38_174]PIQ12165.1 MAG: hypothetical protein COW68_00605 [Candidatus Gracilibacteria bacterium CG18_big_fil_WC_8_21_14_2_50_38_16]PIQ41476.1 MAG: hypothetical protein COW06_02740 [Candidatus Gracilibacteria bacterium CG12_big_fil_rev_8_21_14_0_65_38_15]PIZ01782.1 MAG: hypothetical protein COY60_01685 [Candidatus Gracilibacteri
MRIGIDCRAYGPSGGYIGKYMESFVSYLMENEDTNEYVLFFSDRGAGEFTSESPRFRTIKTSVKPGSSSEQIFFPYELSKEKLDLMLFPSPNIPLFYFGKSVIILSDLVSYFYPGKHLKKSWLRHWYHFILRKSIQKAGSIIVFSEILKRDIIEIFDTHEEKIHLIPPMNFPIKGGEENEAKQFLMKENISDKYILSVGELREYKNIPRLLQAYSFLLKENETSKSSQKTSFSEASIDLVLVGKEDPTYHEIRSTLIALGLQNRVHIYNVLDEEKIGFLYKNASLYVLSSLYEGSEQSILTPLAFNLPIISSLLPAITKILGKDDAVFFRPMSIIEIQEALKKILSDATSRKNTKDMSLYSTPSISRQILNVFSLHKKDLSSSET